MASAQSMPRISGVLLGSLPLGSRTKNMDRKVAIARYVFVSIEAFAEQALKRLSSYPSDLVQSRFQNATISRCSSCRTLSPRVQLPNEKSAHRPRCHKGYATSRSKQAQVASPAWDCGTVAHRTVMPWQRTNWLGCCCPAQAFPPGSAGPNLKPVLIGGALVLRGVLQSCTSGDDDSVFCWITH